jgi:hypothetical protein
MQKMWHTATKPSTGYVYGRIEIKFFCFYIGAEIFANVHFLVFAKKVHQYVKQTGSFGKKNL